MALGRNRATGLATLCVLTACAKSEVPPAAPAARSATPEPLLLYPRFAELKTFPAVNDSAFPTRGHLVKPSYAVVRASPEARAPYLALVTDSVLPDGATIAMFHESRDESEQGLVYVMEKKGGSWEFFALDAAGHPTSENTSVCALCHRGGVADHLFGLPRSLSSQPSTAD